MNEEKRSIWYYTKEALKEVIAIIWIAACVIGLIAIWTIYFPSIFTIREIETLVIILTFMTFLPFMALAQIGITLLESSKLRLCGRGIERFQRFTVKTVNNIRKSIHKLFNRKRTSQPFAI